MGFHLIDYEVFFEKKNNLNLYVAEKVINQKKKNIEI